jgi:hypothetical protein
MSGFMRGPVNVALIALTVLCGCRTTRPIAVYEEPDEAFLDEQVPYSPPESVPEPPPELSVCDADAGTCAEGLTISESELAEACSDAPPLKPEASCELTVAPPRDGACVVIGRRGEKEIVHALPVGEDRTFCGVRIRCDCAEFIGPSDAGVED